MEEATTIQLGLLGVADRIARELRSPPSTPIMDPWMLKMAGYCPFIATFSRSFYYNSIIVTTLNSLPFQLANVF